MSLQQDIKESIKEAMKAKDQTKLLVLRGLSTAFVNELVSKGKTPQDELSDEDAMAVITRSAKQRKDAADQFEKGGRSDLAENENAELAVLEAFLPELMSKEEILVVAQAKKDQMGVTDKADMGKLIGSIMGELKGKADGGDVKEVVEGLFS